MLNHYFSNYTQIFQQLTGLNSTKRLLNKETGIQYNKYIANSNANFQGIWYKLFYGLNI